MDIFPVARNNHHVTQRIGKKKAMSASRQLLLPMYRQFETRWLVNCTAVAPHRGFLTGTLHCGSRNLTKSSTSLKCFLLGYTRQRHGMEEELGYMRIETKPEEGSEQERSTRRAGVGGVFGCLRLDPKWAEKSVFTTFSSTIGRKAIFRKTSTCVKRLNVGRRCRNAFFSDSRKASCTVYSSGWTPRYACMSSKWADAGFCGSFQRMYCTEVESTSRRSRNLGIYGQSNITNEQVLSEVIGILQEDKNLKVVKLGETCHVRLLVRKSDSDLFLGIAAKGAKVKDVYGRYQFSQCRKNRNIINLCASFPSLKNHSFRWWLIPGESLCHLKSDRVNILPEGKWSRFEISRDDLANAISDEVTRRISYQIPLSEWSIPRSPTHQKELEYFSQMTQKVWAPLACDVTDPPVRYRSVDVIIDGVCVQNKTAYDDKQSRGLRINIYKQGGRDEFGTCTTQPYTIDDGIDAIVVNVRKHGLLTGTFFFPRKEIVARGWFRDNHCSGKKAVHIFPPYLSPRKGYESIQQWQLQYYLDVSEEVDLIRARMLLDQCKTGK